VLRYYAVNVLKKRFSLHFSANDLKTLSFLKTPLAALLKRSIMRAMPRGAALNQFSWQVG
jgi:hypothetical protein